MARPPPLIKQIFKYLLIISLLALLSFIFTLSFASIRLIDESLENEKLRTSIPDPADEEEREKLINIVKFMVYTLTVISLLLILVQITAVVTESVPMLAMSGLLLMAASIVQLVYISKGNFISLVISIPFLLNNVLVFALTVVLVFRIQSESVFGEYIGSLLQSL